MNIADITPGPGEREIVFGGTRAGKSAFMEWETRHIQADRPEAMQVLVDTKPRFRAETERSPGNPFGRRSAAWRYRSWAKGPVVPNSVRVDLDSPHPFRGLWKRPGEIAIMQSGESRDWVRMLTLLNAFTKAEIKGRERRIIVDEVLDFYDRNSFGIDRKNDVFYRAARAGGERNIGLSLGAHRVHGVPPLILSMTSIYALFHLRHDGDMRYLRVYGIQDAESPKGDYVFRRWTVQPGGLVSPPLDGRCTYPESYLAQLAST